MKSQGLLITAIVTFVFGAAWAVHLSRSDQSCPRPSAASVEMLFAPCQAYDEARASISPAPASDGMPTGPMDEPAASPAENPAQIVSQDFRALKQDHAIAGAVRDHATVGTAQSKPSR